MITSPDNEKVKFVRSLYAKKKRYEERAFLVEGIRLLEEALSGAEKPILVLYQPEVLDRTARGRDLLSRLGPDAFSVTERVLGSVSSTVAPQGIVAVWPFPPESKLIEGTLALVLDGIRDPGNLGTILRTAVAAGVTSVVATSDTVDPFGEKAVRAGMGAHFRLKLFIDESWDQIESLTAGRQIFLAAAHARTPYYEVDWTQPSVLIIGSEAHGAGEWAKGLAHEPVTIPMAKGVESLNAAVAAGVLLFEAFRQQSKVNRVEG